MKKTSEETYFVMKVALDTRECNYATTHKLSNKFARKGPSFGFRLTTAGPGVSRGRLGEVGLKTRRIEKVLVSSTIDRPAPT